MLINASVLGLRISYDDKGYYWERDGLVDEVGESLTKRELFSLSGKLVGHGREGVGWDDRILPEADAFAREMVSRVMDHDSVKGVCDMKENESCVVWCAASSLTVAACIEVKENIVEDGSWKESERFHINLAELKAVIKGLNLALQWYFMHIELVTDSRECLAGSGLC